MSRDQKMPLVSVVTPVYNGDKYLDECIQSVLAQTYQNLEYIILNNCSTDRTLEIAKSYAAKEKKIRIFNTETLLPIMKNWNRALSHISPDSNYCKVVHADDFLFPECLERMVSLSEAYPTVGIVGSYSLWGNRVVSDGLPYSVEFVSGKELCRMTLLDQIFCFWSPTSLLIKSDFIRKREFFYNEAYLHADDEASYEVLRESDFGFIHQVLTFIRQHEESMTSLAAAPYNKIILSNLDLYTRFGPIYLSSDEYKRHLAVRLNKYYHFLARSLFNWREKDFWEYHKQTLQEIGHPFSLSKLIKASISELIHRPIDTAVALVKAVTKSRYNRNAGNQTRCLDT
jgi:glycosyltransferase involved in cell wall biosynthesis